MLEIIMDFRSHGLVCYAGELRRVDNPEARAAFIAAGWAKEPGAAAVAPDLSEKTLEVQNLRLGHAAEVPGVV